MQISLINYEKLLLKIQKVVANTKKNLVKIVDHQKVKMSWQIGKEIEGNLKGNNRAEYGKELFTKLEKDTGIAQTSLYKMHAFYKAYPKLPSENKALSWSHYRSLIAVKDEETRRQLEDLVIKNQISSDNLQEEIAATKKSKKKISKPKTAPKLKVKRGRLFTYKLTLEEEIDLGFNIFVEKKLATNLATLTTSNSDYTYIAKLEKVVDGDTLHVKLDLGFGVKHHEIIRLAKINAAEAKTSQGQKAKAKLQKILKDTAFLILKTNKTDIYGRYVADVFFDKSGKEKDANKVASEGVYLNQLLLDLGLAETWV